MTTIFNNQGLPSFHKLQKSRFDELFTYIKRLEVRMQATYVDVGEKFVHKTKWPPGGQSFLQAWMTSL